MTDLIFIEKVSSNREAFATKVKAIARRHGFNPNWLMALMNSETGGTFRSDTYNLAGSGAVGLIQFMPSTAQWLGTSTPALASMSNVEQLDWVEKYIVKWLQRFDMSTVQNYNDLYLMIFYPVAIGKPDGWAFPSSIYSQNKGMDMNKDGVITIADFKAFIRKMIPANRLIEFTGKNRYRNHIIFGIVLAVTLVVGWVVYSRKVKLKLV
jgi:hypothetical protein